MLRLLLTCSLVITFTLPAMADTYPAAVQKAVSDMDDMCTSAGAKPAPSEGLVLSSDLNGDGKSDYAIFEGAYVCEGAASLFAGTAGSSATVYVSDATGNYSNAWSAMVYGIKLGDETPAKLWFDVGGESCGQKGQVVHATMDSCSRALMWNAATSKVDFEALNLAKPMSTAE